MIGMLSLLCLLLIVPGTAYAHSGPMGGFMAGIEHPVLGLDHLLAMVGVGVVSAQIGGRAIWLVPSTFVSVMALGGALGMAGFPLYDIEIGIACSVIALGFMIALEGFKTIVTLLAVAFFAIFHGYAHGVEIPELVTSWTYIAGFMTGTALLHIAGVIIGLVSERHPEGRKVLRYAGAVVAGMGIHMLAGIAGL